MMLPRTGSHHEVPSALPSLYAHVRNLPTDAIIVQRAPVNALATIELARACSGTRRRVHVEWPTEEQSEDPSRQLFLAWHRPLIESGLLPFVRVERDVGPLLPRAALVHADVDEGRVR